MWIRRSVLPLVEAVSRVCDCGWARASFRVVVRPLPEDNGLVRACLHPVSAVPGVVLSWSSLRAISIALG
jgi:hypothetical protein